MLAQAIRIRMLALTLTIYIILSSLYGIWQLLVQTQNAHKDDSILDKKTYGERNNINTVFRLIVLHVFSTRIKSDIRRRKHSPTYTCIATCLYAHWTDSNGKYFRNFSESFLSKKG